MDYTPNSTPGSLTRKSPEPEPEPEPLPGVKRMQLTIGHEAYEYLRWHWGSGRCIFNGSVLVGAAVRPLYARRLCEIARRCWAGLSVKAALDKLFELYPTLMLAGRAPYVIERARLSESPEMQQARQQERLQRQQERLAQQAVDRQAWEERRVEGNLDRLHKLMQLWDAQQAAAQARAAVARQAHPNSNPNPNPNPPTPTPTLALSLTLSQP